MVVVSVREFGFIGVVAMTLTDRTNHLNNICSLPLLQLKASCFKLHAFLPRRRREKRVCPPPARRSEGGHHSSLQLEEAVHVIGTHPERHAAVVLVSMLVLHQVDGV